MARKLNLMSFLQQARGLNALDQRFPQPPLLERGVLPLPSPPPTHGQRLPIPIHTHSYFETPSPVKIVRLSAVKTLFLHAVDRPAKG
jgi:hypothetical protein